MHFRFYQMTSVIAGTLLPNFPATPASGIEDSVTSCARDAALSMAWHGISARWDDRLRTAMGNGLVTGFRVAGAVTTYACDGLVIGNLVEQAWQHRRGAGHFDGRDFQRSRIDAKMDLAPPATVVGAVVLHLPFVFTEHLMPVLSTRGCNPVIFGCAPIVSAKYFWRRLTMLKSGTCQSRSASLSRLYYIPIALHRDRLNRPLIIGQN